MNFATLYPTKYAEFANAIDVAGDTFESMSLAIGKEVYVILKMNTIRVYETEHL